jgi:hypothetical protein
MISVRRSFLIAIGLIVVSLLVYAHWWRTTEVVFVGNILQASALAFCGMKFNDVAFNSLRDKKLFRGWACIAAGLWFWFLAQLFESYSEMILVTGSYGTVADSFWCLGSMFYFMGIITLLRRFWIENFHLTAGASISLIVIIGYYAIVLVGVILPHVMDPTRGLPLKFLDFAYPTLDVATGFCFCLLIFLARQRGDRELKLGAQLICAAFFIYSASDLMWGYFRDVNTLIYRLQDIMFFVGYCINAIAAIPFEARSKNPATEVVKL